MSEHTGGARMYLYLAAMPLLTNARQTAKGFRRSRNFAEDVGASPKPLEERISCDEMRSVI